MKSYLHIPLLSVATLLVCCVHSQIYIALAVENEAVSTADMTSQITGSPFFHVPVTPVGGVPSDDETKELWDIVVATARQPASQKVKNLETFLQAHPASPWAASIQANLGRYYEARGRYSLAAESWRAAWKATWQESDPSSKHVADFSYASLGRLLLGFGQVADLGPLLGDGKDRAFQSRILQQTVNTTREQYLKSITETDVSFRCGSLALAAVARHVGAPIEKVKGILAIPSPVTGFSLLRLAGISQAYELPFVAMRSLGTNEIIVPSVIHWKGNHFAAVIEKRGEFYRVSDPGLGKPKWMTAPDICAEASGYYLLPRQHASSSFMPVSDDEAAKVFGRGYTESIDDSTDSCANGSGGSTGSGAGGTESGGEGGMGLKGGSLMPPCSNGCGTGGGSSGGSGSGCPTCSQTGGDNRDDYHIARDPAIGMPVWEVSEPYINLWLYDQPLGYRAGFNQDVAFRLSYKQRENRPASANFFGFGELWNCSWLSYVIDEAPGAAATMINQGGGEREYYPDGTSPEYYSFSTMNANRDSGQLTGFVVNYSDGSQDEYGFVAQIDLQNCAFLTAKRDPQGHTLRFIYNSGPVVKLLYVVDADGRTNTLKYADSIFPNQVTSVEDPFSREAFFAYNELGMLTNIVDVQGLSSSVHYDHLGWVTNLTTPYGATRFEHWTNFTGDPDEFGIYYSLHTPEYNNSSLPTRAVRVIDPLNQTNVYMLKQDCAYVWTNYLNFDDYNYAEQFLDPYTPRYGAPPVDPHIWLDSSVKFEQYSWPHYRNTFHWGPKQAAVLPGNLTAYSVKNFLQGRMRHWLHGGNDLSIGQVLSMEQQPSPDGITPGQTTWFAYRYRTSNPPYAPDESLPAIIAYPINHDSSYSMRFTWFDRDERGRATNVVSTYSVETELGYVYPLLRTNSYIYAGNDLLFDIGPDGNTNRSYVYDGNHRLLRMTNASRGVHYYTYDSRGRLTSTTTPAGLTTTNIYFASGPYTNWISTTIDIQIGRQNSYTYTNNLIHTHTDERGLTTVNTWDALGRLQRVDYPDNTFIANTYHRLDLVQTVDRLGNPTFFGYDNVRRLIAKTNALGNYTLYQYCSCGGLESIQNEEGDQQWYFYDNAGRHVQTVLPGPYVINFHRNHLGQITNVTDSAGLNTTNWYNNQGLLYASSNAFGRINQVWYDLEDRATNTVDANGIELRMTYDAAGRLATRTYPDQGVESFGYSERGLIAHTNQIGMTNFYAYDAAGRKIFETNANWEITQFRYDPSGSLTNLIDGKNQNTFWKYNEYGQVTNKTDHLGTTLFSYGYDANGRLISRISAAKGQTIYQYDAVGSLTNINYPISPDIAFRYDAANRLTNMVDVTGATRYSYDALGQLLSEDGPWVQDAVNYSYVNRLRTGMALEQPGASPWVVSYGYDIAKRLTNVSSAAGPFEYDYRLDPETLSPGSLVRKLALPAGWYIDNQFDEVGRLLSTSLKNSQDAALNSHAYLYNPANQRTQQVFTAGNYTDYTYDKIGQLKRIVGREANGTTLRPHERFGYSYDAAGNLEYRTNYFMLQTFKLNPLNQITNLTRPGGVTMITVAGTTTSAATNVAVSGTGLSLGNAGRFADNTWARYGAMPVDGSNTYTAVAKDAYGRSDTNTVSVFLPVSTSFAYDLNGNLLSDGRRGFEYDDENQLVRVTMTNAWRSEFVYDGKMRRRERIECVWQGGAWVTNEIVHYIYDGNLVLQERHYNNPQLPTLNPQLVTYTRGLDLSGSLQGAGGIGGLLARSEISNLQSPHAYYHADGNGNVTALVNANNAVVAKYIYDPYGNLISASGPLAEANLYRFSSKEWHVQSGLVYYLYRHYEPSLQRWINRDPIEGITGSHPHLWIGMVRERNGYGFAWNSPALTFDSWGLLGNDGIVPPKDHRGPSIQDLLNYSGREWGGWSQPLCFFKTDRPRNCNLEAVECGVRGMIVCGAVEKVGKLAGPWVYRTCIFTYGVVCAQQKRECDQWNKDHGF